MTVDSATESLTEIISKTIDLFISKRLSKPFKYPFWFLKYLKHFVHKKDHFHKSFKRSGGQLWYINFSFYRALLKTLFKRDKTVYGRGVASSLCREPNQFWQLVKQHTKELTRDRF